MSRSLFALVILLLTACGPSPAPQSMSSTASAADDRPRFDVLVRDDFFAGIRGDLAALDRAIALCEKTLASDPRHAEAMVWHGAALVAKSALAFRKGDTETGRSLWIRGTAEMDRAVSLEPENVGTLVP